MSKNRITEYFQDDSWYQDGYSSPSDNDEQWLMENHDPDSDIRLMEEIEEYEGSVYDLGYTEGMKNGIIRGKLLVYEKLVPHTLLFFSLGFTIGYIVRLLVE